MNYGWAGTIEQFKQLDVQFFVKQLLDHVFELPPSVKNVILSKKKLERITFL
ncbi:hypothetical protein [Bacillus mycoides]